MSLLGLLGQIMFFWAANRREAWDVVDVLQGLEGQSCRSSTMNPAGRAKEGAKVPEKREGDCEALHLPTGITPPARAC